MGQRPQRVKDTFTRISVFEGEDAIRRIITVRGRTGAVLALWPASQENAVTLADLFRKHVSKEVLQQVRFLAHDDPSGHMYRTMADIMPNMRVLCLDCVHLPMVYEYGFWRKRTAGSCPLRRIMGRFTPKSPPPPSSGIGAPFTRGGLGSGTFEGEIFRRQILDSSMPILRAHAIIDGMRFDEAFTNRVAFVESLAALSALHQDEMNKLIPGPNRTVGEILASATHPSRACSSVLHESDRLAAWASECLQSNRTKDMRRSEGTCQEAPDPNRPVCSRNN